MKLIPGTRRIDLTGERYGRLIAIREVWENEKWHWVCKCDCGNETTVLKSRLRSGKTRSCGCLSREIAANNAAKLSYKHGKTKTRLHRIWTSMKGRCYIKSYASYKSYGERGIGVCDEWKNDFMAFYNWAMENGYRDGLTLDRIDGDMGYSPSNCRWATPKEQGRNRRTNVFLEINGERKTVVEWAELSGTNEGTIRSRLIYAWPAYEAVYGRKYDSIGRRISRKNSKGNSRE